ncbi:GTP-binding protein Rit1-like [Pollicipes pollicipes]|uniref:GTP-binding protein Rit1-like n=1 Tax=Pollicipes pollicipes TaxID=41117 RepID=UPI0018850E58|nr:GTP-binding protein Rit1-like [Pollicipes pollicipes]XP_037082926.1 GTP-binding protein Rit1-like [Pollicipes pollicipes]XP_037082975.1 GTP-binding protein Rit1-like [Pollicipes pollicipes]XP_037082976.1 GTP-binding protein Rit1-like [Pollicipes pollicipes]
MPQLTPCAESRAARPGRSRLRVYKVVVLGEGGVGKSALVLQFVSHNFIEYHDPTIEDAYQQQAVIDGEPALLDILDTAGQVEFTAMKEQYMRCGEGFIICYSICDRRSFEEVAEYRRLLSRVRASDDVPLVIVGCKLDLDQRRKVTPEEGRDLARELNAPFFETSAAYRRFVDDSFHALVRIIRSQERDKTEEEQRRQRRRTGVAPRIRKRWHRLCSLVSLAFRRRRRDRLKSPATV